MTLEEFEALVDRKLEAERFTEYCSALPTWLTYSIHRNKQAPVHGVEYFMFQYRARQQVKNSQTLDMPGTPTGLPGPAPGVRYALPGECPPSRRPPGTNDDVMERFDLYMARQKKAGK